MKHIVRMYKLVLMERNLSTNNRFDPWPDGLKGGGVGGLCLEFCERGDFNKVVEETYKYRQGV